MRVRITGGTHRGRTLRSSGSGELRPTTDRVRGAIFSILGQNLVEDAKVLDLYAGTGALGIEALSRGASWCDFVESDSRRARQIRDSLETLTLSELGHVIHARVERVIGSLPEPYEIIFIDPPYRMTDWDRLMAQIGEGRLVKQGGLVVAEHRSQTSLQDKYEWLDLDSNHKYGDTSISIFKGGGIDG